MHVDLTTEQKDLQAELRDYFTTLMTDDVKASIRNDELSANLPYRELIRKIAYREGLGDVLADGSRRVIETWPEMHKVVLAVKGLEQSAYDSRAGHR